jgi:hypothetical protein
MLDCQQREVLAGYGSKKEKCIPNFSFQISIASSSQFRPHSRPETAQHERSKTSKPFIFNKTTIQNGSCLRGFSNWYVPKPEKYRTNPSTAHDERL